MAPHVQTSAEKTFEPSDIGLELLHEFPPSERIQPGRLTLGLGIDIPGLVDLHSVKDSLQW